MLNELIRANNDLDEALSKIDMEHPDVDEATAVMTRELLPCLANIGELTPEEFIELFIKSNQIMAFKKEVKKAMFMMSQIRGVHEMTQASAD